MNPNPKSSKTEAHHRLTLKDVIRDYKAGLLTPAGAIFYLVCSTYKIGFPIRVSRKQICAQLEIGQATFYRAIAQLESSYRLKFDSPDEMIATVPISTTDGVPDYLFLEKCSQICEKDSQIWESDSQICEKDSQIWESDSQIWESKSPEPAQGNEPEIPQLLQLDQLNQLTTEEVPTSHPVVVEEMLSSGMELTESQLQQIDSFSEEQIRDAFQVVQSSKPKDKIKLFFKALRNGYRPHLPSGATANFRDWFEKARAKGQVIASQLCGDGILRVLMPDDRWLPLADAILEVSGS